MLLFVLLLAATHYSAFAYGVTLSVVGIAAACQTQLSRRTVGTSLLDASLSQSNKTYLAVIAFAPVLFPLMVANAVKMIRNGRFSQKPDAPPPLLYPQSAGGALPEKVGAEST